MCRDAVRNAKASLELKAADVIKTNKKGFCKLGASRSLRIKDEVVYLYFRKVLVRVCHIFCLKCKLWTRQMNHKVG